MKKTVFAVSSHRALSLMTRCVLAAMLPASAAMAIEFDTGNPDLTVRWDNTVRYNLGFRVESQDPRISHTSGNDESDGKFARGDIVTNRVDILSEMDALYQGKHGLRISAAAWYDQAYNNSKIATYGAFPSSHAGGNYNKDTQRFYEGPSGEVLDAFVFTNFDLGDVPVGVRVGKHVLYWGEGLLIGSHAISYSQAPSDGRKALASPGIETKEVFMPINQLSFNAQLNNELSIGGQYFFDWTATRIPSGGTYLSSNDFSGADTFYAGGTTSYPMLPNKQVTDKRGAFGLKLAYNLPSNAKLGVYYRKFDDYAPSGLVIGGPAGVRYGHVEDIKLVGVSLGATVGATSVGWELSRRSNAPLQTTSTNVLSTGARGTTWHMVLNGVRALPELPIYETGTVVAEVAFSHLDKVTANPTFFKGVGAGYSAACAGVNAKEIGCATRNNMVLAVNVTPQWLQVAPGVDLSAPVSVNWSPYGNSANAGSSGNKGEYTFALGLEVLYRSAHTFTLRYQDRYQKTNYAGGLAVSGNGSSYALNDRGYVSFTYKTSF